jgi:HlyD family secretion protein
LLQAEREFLLAEKLFDKGITPKHEFEKIKSQFNYEKSRFSSVQNQQFTIWQEKRKETAMRLAELQAKIGQLQKEKNLYHITAPIAGTIICYNGVQTGNFVVPNQLIAKIASDSDLLVECFVTPNDIGLIEAGMAASFQLHSFNYNLWGMATGKVNEISKNVTSINNQPFFRIKCKLDQQFLQLKNGYKGDLKKGMTLTGRFKVTERTLFQLLYDKADNWLNPKRENG